MHLRTEIEWKKWISRIPIFYIQEKPLYSKKPFSTFLMFKSLHLSHFLCKLHEILHESWQLCVLDVCKKLFHNLEWFVNCRRLSSECLILRIATVKTFQQLSHVNNQYNILHGERPSCDVTDCISQASIVVGT